MRKSVLAAIAALCLTAGCSGLTPGGTPTSPSASGVPNRPAPQLESVGLLAVVGDSVSLGVNACENAGPCPESSWAGGTDETVDSVAMRLAAATGTAPRVVYASRDGGDVKDVANLVLDGINKESPDLVTILIGANDACAVTPEEMTPVAEFREDLRRMLQAIDTGVPGATVLLMSIPNLNQIWESSHDNPAARAAWDGFWGCRNLLRNPTSTAPEVEQSRSAVAEQVTAYNQIIAEECNAVARCVSDGGALHAHRFTPEQISTKDYFHPSRQGQAAIAALAWDALAEASQ